MMKTPSSTLMHLTMWNPRGAPGTSKGVWQLHFGCQNAHLPHPFYHQNPLLMSIVRGIVLLTKMLESRWKIFLQKPMSRSIGWVVITLSESPGESHRLVHTSCIFVLNNSDIVELADENECLPLVTNCYMCIYILKVYLGKIVCRKKWNKTNKN